MERDGKTYCDRHANVETKLRCSRCEAFICPKCAVLTTVGYRCAACGKERSATYTLPPGLLLLGSAGGLLLGGLGGYLSYVIHIGFFLIFVAVIIGRLVGEVVRRLIRRKSSVIVGAVTALGFMAGALIQPFRIAMAASGSGAEVGEVLRVAFGDIWSLLFAVIAGAVAWHRLH
ncbi:MAG: hypothetical protein IH851_04870 [Armatimonadetes bacterium]|nr:hypothetical protein [Armatimonadota bacterium]